MNIWHFKNAQASTDKNKLKEIQKKSNFLIKDKNKTQLKKNLFLLLHQNQSEANSIGVSQNSLYGSSELDSWHHQFSKVDFQVKNKTWEGRI